MRLLGHATSKSDTVTPTAMIHLGWNHFGQPSTCDGGLVVLRALLIEADVVFNIRQPTDVLLQSLCHGRACSPRVEDTM